MPMFSPSKPVCCYFCAFAYILFHPLIFHRLSLLIFVINPGGGGGGVIFSIYVHSSGQAMHHYVTRDFNPRPSRTGWRFRSVPAGSSCRTLPGSQPLWTSPPCATLSRYLQRADVVGSNNMGFSLCLQGKINKMGSFSTVPAWRKMWIRRVIYALVQYLIFVLASLIRKCQNSAKGKGSNGR
jgi:hypothetical protein